MCYAFDKEENRFIQATRVLFFENCLPDNYKKKRSSFDKEELAQSD